MKGYQFILITPGDWSNAIHQHPDIELLESTPMNFDLDYNNKIIRYTLLNSIHSNYCRDRNIPYQTITISESVSNTDHSRKAKAHTPPGESILLGQKKNNNHNILSDLPFLDGTKLIIPSKNHTLKHRNILKGSLKKKLT
tara:strand:- start:102 stop:521 length:420 start_codon:yes stop_codon:yes gene_type:complete